ncbi:hypothetical protein CLM71_22425 [Serratia sp. MYb239]|uniref:DUF943 family protein n=1 Tax=Serratia sp. MYb239 TaxID=2033438 RepID=UPI000CF67EC5|nr:DUF943 family protein [Serratia sp. MYb239]AVJ20190.1 hypothetical protein CLM71_22425 [Serratia sp. MYb239]QPT15861.1 DUF943 family protein [Serratia rubidaea]
MIYAAMALFGFFLWCSLQPVEIIAIHQRENYSDVLVKNFPFTDKGKIKWWLDNKNNLKEKYGIPKPDSDGFFTVIFWDFGDGYKEAGKYDRMCFDDMKEKENCIEKNVFFIAENDRDKDMLFVADGGRYLMKKNGELIKLRRD